MPFLQRKNMPLKEYDYSQDGYYFVTICTQNKENIFGEIVDGEVILNFFGKIAENELDKLQNRFSSAKLDKYIVMPNHIHIIVIINKSNEERSRPFPTIPKIIGLYKSGVSRNIHLVNPNIEIWQKSYYDHVIRSEIELREIREYINSNPLKWEVDKYYKS